MNETLLKLLMEAKGELSGAVAQMEHFHTEVGDEIVRTRVLRAKDILDSMEIVLRTEGR